ncbi:MAG: NAD(P)/FAD-dependent oxidoreductase, partial [Dehalococcoidia bacterium]|nr:NAD(P)/FAD-dependent oxidoreductase [Dehalococcoidia bacterium]
MNRKYDVIIVGAGPAGIFAALELCQSSNLKILLLEKGKDLDRRRCPAADRSTNCISCSPCNMVSGLGGAGAYSDGKMTLSPDVGGRLKELIGERETCELIRYVDSVYL